MFFQQIEAQEEHIYANLRRDAVVSDYDQIQVTHPHPHLAPNGAQQSTQGVYVKAAVKFVLIRGFVRACWVMFEQVEPSGMRNPRNFSVAGGWGGRGVCWGLIIPGFSSYCSEMLRLSFSSRKRRPQPSKFLTALYFCLKNQTG